MSIEETRKLIVGEWYNDTYGLWNFKEQENSESAGFITLINETTQQYLIAYNSDMDKYLLVFKESMTYVIDFIYENILILDYKSIKYNFIKKQS